MSEHIGLISTVTIMRAPFNARQYYYEQYSSLGLLSIASVLEASGYQIELMDLNYELNKQNINYSGNKKFYWDVTDIIRQKNLRILGFTTLSDSLFHTLKIAECYKKLFPKSIIILGGPQATFTDGEIIDTFPFIDIIVRGEGEETILELMGALRLGRMLSNVKGITYRKNGFFKRTEERPLIENLDSLPMPAYHLLNEKILRARSFSIDVGRGCPFLCKFCSTSPFWERRFRIKSTGRVIKEIAYLKEKFRAYNVSFTHDLFTLDRKWVKEFCTTLIREGIKIGWDCSARIDTVDTELINLMSKSGCYSIFFGIETGSQKIQRIIGKNLKLSELQSKVHVVIGKNIDPILSFIAGFPEEDLDDLEATLNIFLSLYVQDGHPSLNILAPIPGSEYVNQETKVSWDNFSLFQGFLGVNSAKNLRLVKQHPRLFPNFHYFLTPHIPREILNGMDRFCLYTLAIYRYTIYAILRECEVKDVLKLYKMWIKWRKIKGCAPYWINNDKFYLFLHELIRAKGGSKKEILLAQLRCEHNFSYRLRKQARKQNMQDTQYNKNIVPFNPVFPLDKLNNLFPKMTQFFRLKSFKYDILDVISDLKMGRNIKQIPKKTKILFYIPTKYESIMTARVSESLEFIIECIKERKGNVSSLISMILEEWEVSGSPEQARMSCLKMMKDIWAQGIIVMRNKV
jgi:radical SAM superfamily enzyme YgiQ (UPF0313 family)